jgi:hypothetical protein
MTPRTCAQILHEVVRQWHIDTGRHSEKEWANESVEYRASMTQLVLRVIRGESDPHDIARALGPAGRIAEHVLIAIAPKKDDDEPTGEPDRKPAYDEKYLRREAPHIREAKAPGECVTITS